MSLSREARRARAGSLVNPATIILVCAVGLALLGLTILFSASAWFKKGPYFYLNKQVIGVVAAALVCFVTSRLNLDYVRRYCEFLGGAEMDKVLGLNTAALYGIAAR